MNFIRLLNVIILTLALVSTRAWPQQDSRVAEFENAPADKALLLFLDSNEPPELQVQMMRSVLRDEKYDLFALIFAEHYGLSPALNATRDLSDSSTKDKSVVVMLRTDSAFWYRPLPPMESDVSRSARFDNAVEPFVGVIAKYLPGLTINDELFSTRTRRLELADQLEAKMASQTSQPTTPRETKRRPVIDESETVPQKPAPGKAEIPQNPKEEKRFPSSSHNSQAVLAIVAAAIIALIWAWRRKTLHKRH